MFQPDGFGKILIVLGISIVLLGLLFTLWNKIPFVGRLPGDLIFQKGDSHFFFPIITCILISLVLTVVLNIVFRLFR